VARLSKRRRQELTTPGSGSTPRPKTTPSRYRTQKVELRSPWWQSPWTWGSGVTLVVVAVIVVFVVLAASAPPPSPDALASSSLVSEVTGVSPSTLAAVGSGGLSNPLQKLPASAKALTGSNGKPEVVMISEDSCPFCAFERWSVVVALSRFGTFTNLHVTTSASGDVYPDTNTFSFYGSSYSSSYLDFEGVETTDRSGNTLQTPTAAEQSILSTWDVAPYSSQDGGLPFIDLGGRYLASGAPTVDVQVNGQTAQAPALIEGMTWQQIASSLNNSSTNQAKTILGNANYLTAAICKLTGNQPGSVCGTSTITQLETKIG
jgi:hypothetical protein